MQNIREKILGRPSYNDIASTQIKYYTDVDLQDEEIGSSYKIYLSSVKTIHKHIRGALPSETQIEYDENLLFKFEIDNKSYGLDFDSIEVALKTCPDIDFSIEMSRCYGYDSKYPSDRDKLSDLKDNYILLYTRRDDSQNVKITNLELKIDFNRWMYGRAIRISDIVNTSCFSFNDKRGYLKSLGKDMLVFIAGLSCIYTIYQHSWTWLIINLNNPTLALVGLTALALFPAYTLINFTLKSIKNSAMKSFMKARKWKTHLYKNSIHNTIKNLAVKKNHKNLSTKTMTEKIENFHFKRFNKLS